MSLRIALAVLTWIFLFAERSAAQCTTPDGLDAGPACNPVNLVLPQKAFTQPALGICWRDCGVDVTANYTAQWGGLASIWSPNPPMPSCGWYSGRLGLYQGTTLHWLGTLHFSYSRTWTEINGVVRYQVWRYLVNGDLSPKSTAPGPCAVPPCAPAFGNRVRFTGYVDYALNCSVAGSPYEHAWMITHACDAIDHAAGFPRAGVFHPNRFYTFVGPSAGFVPMAGTTTEVGVTAIEAIRRWNVPPMPARCNYEERLQSATINPSATLCVCGNGPPLWYEAFVNIIGGAGTVVTPFPGSDPFRSFPIGAWTNGAVFPGQEEVRYNTNELRYIDCTSFTRQEYYFGVTTAKGFPAFTIPSQVPPPPPQPLPTTFIDQSNSVLLPANVATRNQPYRSDHILNLNL